MAENLGKWRSGRGPISKIRPSDGCGRDAVPLAVERWYDFHEFGCHLGNVGYNDFRASIGEPFSEKLIEHLKAFDDPHQAVRREVDMVRRKPFVPNDMVLHGLVYELETARLEVVVDGYAQRSE